MSGDVAFADYPVLSDLQSFDPRSGTLFERLVFNHRLMVLFLCAVLVGIPASQAGRLVFNASFEKTIPVGHPYIVHYLGHKNDLHGSANAVRVAVERTGGSILDAGYLDTLRRINDELYLIPGVDRPYVRSLWMRSVRWTAITEEGLEGGPVIPDSYDGSAQSLEQLRANIERSGEIGRLVAPNYRSTVLRLPLLASDANDANAIDYRKFNAALEQVRARYESDDVRIHVTGFAKVVGDLTEGLDVLLTFFFFSGLIAAALLYWHIRCMRSTVLVMSCSLAAVFCLLGLLPMLGHSLDPYSMLAPFLIFAIGISHGVQKMNGILLDVGRGTHRLIAARYCFRRLFLAGALALATDMLGFAVLATIPIRAIQELALAASIGMAILVVTNLIMLPVALSYAGVSPTAARRSVQAWHGGGAASRVARMSALLARPDVAGRVIAVAALLGMAGLAASSQLRIGDLDAGAPELRADSRYNRDNAFMQANFSASSDVLVVLVETPQFRCAQYSVLERIDALEWRLRQLPGVVSTSSMAGLGKRFAVLLNEGNPKWYGLPRSQGMLNSVAARAPVDMLNRKCDLLPLYVHLADHRADTLERVTATVEAFARANDTKDARFLLAAGNAGIEAATNSVVRHARLLMPALLYASIIALCFIAFRSWRAVVCLVLPLLLAMVLCEALMVMLGIGVKVATLPVIALGVGIGVDYGIYVLAVLQKRIVAGMNPANAYRATGLLTGRVVLLTGMMLAAGVGTWAFSPIKFQADMGLLLVFIFIFNMLGALILLPALSRFILRWEAADTVPAAADPERHGGNNDSIR